MIGVWTLMTGLASLGITDLVAANEAQPPSSTSSAGDQRLKMRDPFRMPDLNEDQSRRTELEMHSTDSYKLVGILTGMEKVKALLEGPSGESYFVTERMKIGLKDGVIKKIKSDRILIREKVTNIVGESAFVETELKMLQNSSDRYLLSSVARKKAEVEPTDTPQPGVGDLLKKMIKLPIGAKNSPKEGSDT